MVEGFEQDFIVIPYFNAIMRCGYYKIFRKIHIFYYGEVVFIAVIS